MTSLIEKIQEIARSLEAGAIPFAFGGALALAYATEEPRGTRDVDVNVFVEVAAARAAFAALPQPVRWSSGDLGAVAKDGQVRLFWDDTPVDLFFSTDAFHDLVAQRTRRVPFAGIEVPVLAPVDLAVFKAFFDRTKDWADIEAMRDAGTLVGSDLVECVSGLLGRDDRRVERLRGLLRQG